MLYDRYPPLHSIALTSRLKKSVGGPKDACRRGNYVLRRGRST